MSKLPKVVIIGRMNVGKSTLFNRLATGVKSITLDYAGVTRDFISDIVCWKEQCYELIDTGGISLRKSEDPLQEQVRQIALSVLESADIVIFLVDGIAGLQMEEHEISTILHKYNKDVLLVVNKVDAKRAEEKLYEFDKLGHKEVFPISALHGKGIGELLEAITIILEKKPRPVAIQEEPKYNVVLLGKPNVGKSSLMNILVEQERSIVSDIPGTTRETITEPIHFYKETIHVTDTPGVRRKRGVKEELETLMVKTSLRAVKYANIVLLMIDGTESQLSDQELKLAFYVFDNKKALIILVNKEDITTEQNQEDLAFDLERYPHLMKKIPLLFISCKTGKNIGKILPLITTVWKRYTQWFSDATLDDLFKNALIRTPLYSQGKRLILHKATQVKTGPITILLLVNKPVLFNESHISFFENILRKEYDLKGAPVIFLTRRAS